MIIRLLRIAKRGKLNYSGDNSKFYDILKHKIQEVQLVFYMIVGPLVQFFRRVGFF